MPSIHVLAPRVVCAVLVLVVSAAAWAQASDAPRPHIVFILADDLGYADVGYHGSEIRTPHVDRLAAEGLAFARSYVQPQCTPSRVAFLTGCYPYRFGLHEHIIAGFSRGGLPVDRPTLAERLKGLGYCTAAIGKWHVGQRRRSQLPNQRGFDHFFGCISGSMSYWNYVAGDRYDLSRNGEKIYPDSPEGDEASGNRYVTDLFAEEAVKLIAEHDRQKPLFLYLALTTPHSPWHAPEALQQRYRRAGRSEARAIYMAMVESMDSVVGRVVQALQDAEMHQNTLIVFLSDNGGPAPALNEPFSGVKGTSLEGGVRVPTIARWPGVTQPGAQCDDLVYIADWHATFLELAGGADLGAADIDGVSAAPLLRGEPGRRDAVPIISYADHAYITSDWSLVAVDSDYERLLATRMSGARLYNLAGDLRQRRDASTARPDARRRLFEAFRPHLRATRRGQFTWDMLVAGRYLPQEPGDHWLDAVVDGADPDGLPSRDAFLLAGGADAYEPGRVADTDVPLREIAFGATRAGFLPLWDAVNGGHIFVRRDNLAHSGWPEEGGLLSLETGPRTQHVALTRYGAAVRDADTLYLSMLLQHDSKRQSDDARLTLLRLVSQFSDVLKTRTHENDVACFSMVFKHGRVLAAGRDWGERCPRELTPLGVYDDRPFCLVLKLEFGPTGQDVLTVYVNPAADGDEPARAAGVFAGEFSFDRVRFEANSVYAHSTSLKIDELRMGRSWRDVTP